MLVWKQILIDLSTIYFGVHNMNMGQLLSAINQEIIMWTLVIQFHGLSYSGIKIKTTIISQNMNGHTSALNQVSWAMWRSIEKISCWSGSWVMHVGKASILERKLMLHCDGRLQMFLQVMLLTTGISQTFPITHIRTPWAAFTTRSKRMKSCMIHEM